MMSVSNRFRFIAALLILAGLRQQVHSEESPIAEPPSVESPSAEPLNVLLMIGSHEYHIHQTLPKFAEEHLGDAKVTTVVATDLKTRYGADRAEFPGFAEAAAEADVIVLGVRRRQVRTEVMDAFKAHLNAGKGMVSVRVSVAAFQPIPLIRSSKRRDPVDPPEGYAKWDYFGKEVLGCNYVGHDSSVAFEMTAPDEAKEHPILKGFTQKRGDHLYFTAPLVEGAQPLLVGVSNSPKAERGGQAGVSHPVVWTNQYGEKKARIVGMANGTEADFAMDDFNTLLRNAVYWAGSRDVPEEK